MLTFEGIATNFRFMTVEVTRQLEDTLRLLDQPSERLGTRIRASDDYVDVQKSLLEDQCFAWIRQSGPADAQRVNIIRALITISGNLERIADFSVNISRQVQFLRDYAFIRRFDYRAYFDVLLDALRKIDQALFHRDTALAVRICRAELELDRLYRGGFARIIEDLRVSREPENLVTSLLILHYLERMGDALLNVGEAIILAAMGERLKFHELQALEDTLTAAELRPEGRPISFESIWGTRSGVRIGTVQEPGAGGPAQKVIFKEGDREKLRLERDNIERWGRLAPGLAPRVLEFQPHGQSAALLLEYVDGVTFQEFVLGSGPDGVDRVCALLSDTLEELWRRTRQPRPVGAGYLGQLAARIEDVYRVHPGFRRPQQQIGALRVPALEELLEHAARLETGLAAPFSVFVHGDFNVDNVIYDGQTHRLHFVDLHRSCDLDYVQDVSVFLVSNLRLPVFARPLRRCLNRVICSFLRFARGFARRCDDPTFEARLALGLVRSLISSTRFEFNRRFAGLLHVRAVYLLERLLAWKGADWRGFQVPDPILLL